MQHDKQQRGPGATTAQLRDAIDRGATGSKVAAPDPAAAPLGTDDEAGGAPPNPELVEEVLEREQKSGARAGVPASEQRPSRP